LTPFLHFADRTSEALETIKEAEKLAGTSGERWWCAEMHRLRGVFLMTTDVDEPQIEASFRAAISTAKQQKSTSLATRAEITHQGLSPPILVLLSYATRPSSKISFRDRK
jgi:hypothetical protein